MKEAAEPGIRNLIKNDDQKGKADNGIEKREKKVSFLGGCWCDPINHRTGNYLFRVGSYFFWIFLML